MPDNRFTQMFPDGVWVSLLGPNGEEVSSRVQPKGEPVALVCTSGLATRYGLFNCAEGGGPLVTEVIYPYGPMNGQTLDLTSLSFTGKDGVSVRLI